MFPQSNKAEAGTSRSLTPISIASATLFPVGWTVQDRIGWPLSRLHGTVPLWEAKIASSVERYPARHANTFFV